MEQLGYKKLIVWHKADELAYQVYIATQTFPKEQVFSVTSQSRGAALSIPANIAEGYGRQGRKELRQFANIALGSLAEVRYLIDFSLRLQYLILKQHKTIQNLADEVGRLLWKFYDSIK
jgi:four helix bundle protein